MVGSGGPRERSGRVAPWGTPFSPVWLEHYRGAMLDIRRFRNDLDEVLAQLERRGDPSLEGQVRAAAALDVRERELTSERDALRARIRAISSEVGQLFREGHKEAAGELQAESKALGAREKELDHEAESVAGELRDLLLRIPNTPSQEVPDGTGEADNPVMFSTLDDSVQFAPYQRVPHWEIGAELGVLDNERAVKISGSMFTMLRGQGATLARALCQLALDRNADEFEEIRPPSLVSSRTLTATGQLPKFADDAYQLERDDLWCIPTAEVPLTSIYGDEILDESMLPKKMMAYSPCYRREAGSAGRDTRGLLRCHEFDKVEILALATPAQAPALLAEMTQRAVDTISALGLVHRVIDICTGDLGQSHFRSHDLEVYAPGCDMWLEVSSISWFSDYQARRAHIRYRPSEGGGTQIAHTLNGSALAVPRVLAAVLETHRQEDGSVRIPEPLLPYMRNATSITA
jgi:seryl-tRNA synthetase